MKDIAEVIKAKSSQRDRLAREIEILQQAIIILNQDEKLIPGMDPAVKQWP